MPGARDRSGVAKMIRVRLTEVKATQAQLAQAMDVSLLSVNQLCNGRRRVTTDMAIRLARAFNTSEEFWIILQARDDLRDANEHYMSLLGMYERCKRLPGVQ